jgi:hypothetical protein
MAEINEVEIGAVKCDPNSGSGPSSAIVVMVIVQGADCDLLITSSLSHLSLLKN